ncbi:MAG: helix-turn-helix domain-containing protein [Gemmataceae bacterium]
MRPKAERRFFSQLGRYLAEARRQQKLTQKALALRSGLNKSDVAKIEIGRLPSLEQLGKLANALGLPVQWFLNGKAFPGTEPEELAIELHWLGVVDLHIPSNRILGAFLPPEEIVARAVSGDAPDPRVVEAIPAVLAWNTWKPGLLKAYASVEDRRAVYRIAWLAEVALKIHKGGGFPGGLAAPHALERFLRRVKPPAATAEDDLGRPLLEGTLPPVSRRWRIRYAAGIEVFEQRAMHLFELRSAG